MPVSRDLEKVVHRDVGEEPHRAATRKCYSCSLHCRSEQASAKLNVGLHTAVQNASPLYQGRVHATYAVVSI